VVQRMPTHPLSRAGDNYGEDHIMAMTFGEASDEVHGYMFEGLGIWRGVNLVNGDSGAMSADLILLALTAPFDVVCYPCSHARPPEVSLHLTNGLVSTQIGYIMGMGIPAVFRSRV
jgi:hypothetical protein